MADATDDLALEDMTDEQLAMEAADLRSAIEAINLDLLDDSKGGYWRSDDWRIRARGARAYKQADLNAANALVKARREKREVEGRARKEAVEAQQRAEAQAWQAKFGKPRKPDPAHPPSGVNKGNYVGPGQVDALRIALERDRLKTERVRLCEERERGKDRAILRLFQQEYGMEAYLRLIAMLPDAAATTEDADG